MRGLANILAVALAIVVGLMMVFAVMLYYLERWIDKICLGFKREQNKAPSGHPSKSSDGVEIKKGQSD